MPRKNHSMKDIYKTALVEILGPKKEQVRGKRENDKGSFINFSFHQIHLG
jgi:hypothetical protein